MSNRTFTVSLSRQFDADLINTLEVQRNRTQFIRDALNFYIANGQPNSPIHQVQYIEPKIALLQQQSIPITSESIQPDFSDKEVKATPKNMPSINSFG